MMQSPRNGSPRRSKARRMVAWAGLAAVLAAPTVGCQVEYGGMTLPSGKYLYDDVQYFPPGPNFPWANTQAATQRARMQAQGLDVGIAGAASPGASLGPNDFGTKPGVLLPPNAQGAMDPTQFNPAGGGAPNLNNQLNPPGGPGRVPNVPGPVPPAGDPGIGPAGGNPGIDAAPGMGGAPVPPPG